MTITEAFLQGKSTNLEKVKPHHIVTVVSNVFIFDSKVYKVYKNDSEFFNKNFNDLSKKDNRFQFTRNDFEMNHRLSPEIYLELKGVKLKNDQLLFTEPNDYSDELVIEMKKFERSNQLINCLVDNRLTLDDCYKIGMQLGQRLSNLPVLKPYATAYEDFLSRYDDIRPWIAGVEKYIPKAVTEKHLNFVKTFIDDHKVEFDSKNLMGTCIDIHADNSVYSGGIFLPIDVYAPKEKWLHGYKFLNVYRIATDIYGFLGKKGFENVLSGYKDTTHEDLPRQYDKFLITYCELINWPYQYMLSEKEPWRLEVAKKYEAVLEDVFRGV